MVKRAGLQILIGLVVLVSSCSPQARLTRLLNRHPYLITADSVTIYDTTRIDGHRVDTMFTGSQDTFYIERDRVHTRIIKNLDTIWVLQKADSLQVVSKTTTISKTPKLNKFDYWPILSLVLIFLVGFLLRGRLIKKTP